MKKLFYFLLVTLILCVMMTSCFNTKPCAAYGESKYYQRERMF